MYVKKERLVELVREAQAGHVTDEFVNVVYHIADGLLHKFHFAVDPEDFRQNAALTVLRHVQKIDPDRSPFNYLTTTVRNTAHAMLRKQNSDEKKLNRLGDRRRSELGTVDTREGELGLRRIRKRD